MAVLRVIFDEPRDGKTNMSVDRALFQKAVDANEDDAVLRFYRFEPPVLTVGYGTFGLQVFSGQEVIKRPTGGGAVWHKNDLIYSLVLPIRRLRAFGRTKESYRFIHSVLCETFAQHGVTATLFSEPQEDYFGDFCFERPVCFDVMLDGKKIAGAGQKRSRTHLLHQGSIAWDRVVSRFPLVSEENFKRTVAVKLAALFDMRIAYNSLILEDLLKHCDGEKLSDEIIQARLFRRKPESIDPERNISGMAGNTIASPGADSAGLTMTSAL